MAEPFIGELRIVSWNFAPKGWALCNGQILAIAQNQALFSLLGTTYGGNGTTSFALPDLRGRAPLHVSGQFVAGQKGGEVNHTLIVNELPSHNHTASANTSVAATSNSNNAVATSALGQTIGTPASGAAFPVSLYGSGAASTALAPQTISTAGSSQPHPNMQPYTVLNYIIALVGIFPSQN